jgi:hypothetical protein
LEPELATCQRRALLPLVNCVVTASRRKSVVAATRQSSQAVGDVSRSSTHGRCCTHRDGLRSLRTHDSYQLRSASLGWRQLVGGATMPACRESRRAHGGARSGWDCSHGACLSVRVALQHDDVCSRTRVGRIEQHLPYNLWPTPAIDLPQLVQPCHTHSSSMPCF